MGLDRNPLLPSKNMRFFTLILLALLATPFQANAENPGIKSITLVSVPEPNEYVTMNKGSAAGGLGAIGGALMALDGFEKTKGLLGALARSKFSFSEQLTQDLSAALDAGGYRVVMATADRGGRPDKLLDDYAAIWAANGESDAVLDVSVVNVGYSTEHFMFSPFWRPDVTVRASLVLRTTGERLYEERIMYGYHNMFMSAVKIDSPKEYQFADQDALNAAEDTLLINGLKDASRRIAVHIVENMLKL